MIKLKVLGIIGATLPYLFIVASIALSPWFDFYDNALSDLGNIARNGYTAYLFNLGLMITGVIVAFFAILLSVQKHSWKFLTWTPLLMISAFDLFLIGVFSEDAGKIHWIVSVIFFVTITVLMFIYSYISWPLGSPEVGAISLIFGLTSAFIWFIEWPWANVAIQESVTGLTSSIWLILVSYRNV
ncbi:MAG: DUF998 domain-containing protein [Nitrososphaeria archaeon]